MDRITLDPALKISPTASGLSLKKGREEIYSWTVTGTAREDLLALLETFRTEGVSGPDLLKLRRPFRRIIDTLVAARVLTLAGKPKKIITEAFFSGKKNETSPGLFAAERNGTVELSVPFSGVTVELSGKLEDLLTGPAKREWKTLRRTSRKMHPEELAYHGLMDSLQRPLPRIGPAKKARSKKVPSIPYPEDADPGPELMALFQTESSRHFARKITLRDLTRLCRLSLAGKRRPRGYPSAGAVYETGIFLTAHDVEGLETGLYEVLEDGLHLHKSSPELLGAFRAHAASGMRTDSPPHAVIWLAPDFRELLKIYRNNAVPLALMNAGVLLDRLYLAAHALDLPACAVGKGLASCELQDLKILRADQYFVCGFAI